MDEHHTLFGCSTCVRSVECECRGRNEWYGVIGCICCIRPTCHNTAPTTTSPHSTPTPSPTSPPSHHPPPHHYTITLSPDHQRTPTPPTASPTTASQQRRLLLERRHQSNHTMERSPVAIRHNGPTIVAAIFLAVLGLACTMLCWSYKWSRGVALATAVVVFVFVPLVFVVAAFVFPMALLQGRRVSWWRQRAVRRYAGTTRYGVHRVDGWCGYSPAVHYQYSQLERHYQRPSDRVRRC